jgi:hypothetical protein
MNVGIKFLEVFFGFGTKNGRNGFGNDVQHDAGKG